MNNVELDGETTDRITLLTLKEHRNFFVKEMEEFKNGKYLHPEDVAKNIKLTEAINLLINEYFGR